MKPTEQEQKFRNFIQSDAFSDREEDIRTGKPVIALSPVEGEPWHLTTDQMEAILREYYPDLSATTYGERCVIFYEVPATFYVYAGYYELYLSTEMMPEPYMYQAEYDDIDEALEYIHEIDPEAIIYCDNVKDYLPDYIYEWNQEHDYEYFHLPTEEDTDRPKD